MNYRTGLDCVHVANGCIIVYSSMRRWAIMAVDIFRHKSSLVCLLLIALLVIYITDDQLHFITSHKPSINRTPDHAPDDVLADLVGTLRRNVTTVKSHRPEHPTTTTSVIPTTAAHSLLSAACIYCHVFDLWSNKTFSDFDCVDLHFKVSVPSKICLYEDNQDIWVSKDLRMSGQWEPGMVQRFQGWLLEDPGAGVIDLGTNLGVYSLVAAATGHNVVSIEPNIHNIRRFHKAVKLSKLENRITLLQNAVSDKRGIAGFKYSENNQGDTQMVVNSRHGRNVTDEEEFSKMIVLDDILSFCKFKTAVLKIDIQGFEHRAFAHAEVLFDTVDIKYVMMEWEIMKVIYQKRTQKVEDYNLVIRMLDFFYRRHYEPTQWGGYVLQRALWPEWPNDMLWTKTLSS